MALALLPALLLPLGWWRVEQVVLEPCRAVPPSVQAGLSDLRGVSPLALDLRWVQRQVDAWPGVASVSVAFELPSTLRVQARPARPAGSIRLGRGWHAVAATGEPGERLEAPVWPVLEGFACVKESLRAGLEVGLRLQEASRLPTRRVRLVIPNDHEAVLGPLGEPPVTVRVASEATTSEREWCEAVRAGARPAEWTDLRQPNRLVIRRRP